MLLLARNMNDFNFRFLMDIYEEGNLENGRNIAPTESDPRCIAIGEASFYQYLTECFFTLENAYYAIWMLDGSYVSALRLQPYQDGMLIAALETRPACRKKGYAKALLAAVMEQFPQTKLYSHVAKRNIPSIQTHIACGFDRILEHAVYADGSVFTSSCTFLRNTCELPE